MTTNKTFMWNCTGGVVLDKKNPLQLWHRCRDGDFCCWGTFHLRDAFYMVTGDHYPKYTQILSRVNWETGKWDTGLSGPLQCSWVAPWRMGYIRKGFFVLMQAHMGIYIVCFQFFTCVAWVWVIAFSFSLCCHMGYEPATAQWHYWGFKRQLVKLFQFAFKQGPHRHKYTLARAHTHTHTLS